MDPVSRRIHRVIGVDPGTRLLGWAVVEREGNRLCHVAHGVIKPPLDGEFADRLVAIDDELGQVLATYQPEAGAIETIFFSKNAQSAAKLGHARGVILLRLRRAGLSIHEYPPRQIKQTVVGTGRADKRQVAMLVRAALGLSELPPSDAADALAAALTYLQAADYRAALGRIPPR